MWCLARFLFERGFSSLVVFLKPDDLDPNDPLVKEIGSIAVLNKHTLLNCKKMRGNLYQTNIFKQRHEVLCNFMFMISISPSYLFCKKGDDLSDFMSRNL